MDQTAQISSAEEQLKRFGSFLDDYDTRLCRLLRKANYNECENIFLNSNEWIVKANYSTNQETLPLLTFLDSDRLLNKTILTFAHLCSETDEMIGQAKKMQLQFLYIDEDLYATKVAQCDEVRPAESKDNSSQQFILKMSNSLEFMCHIQFFLQRCVILANNILHQCGALLASELQKPTLKLFDVLDFFSNILSEILCFDEILQNSNYSRFWASYKRTVDTISRNQNTNKLFSTSEINGLFNCLQELDFIFSGKVFRSFLDSTFALKDKIGSKGIGYLTQHFSDYMKFNIARIEKFTTTDLNSFNEPQLIIRLTAFSVVFHDFCGQVDPKQVKSLLELNTKYQGITLVGNVEWKPVKFLKKHAETLVKPYEKQIQEIKRQWQNYLNIRLATLSRDCKNYCTRTSLWSLQVNKALQAGAFELKVEQFKGLTTLLLLGSRYAGQMGFLVRSLINAHVYLQSSMTKFTLLSVCKFIEMIKIIQLTFQKGTESISKIIHCILQYLQYKLIHLFAGCKKKLTNSTMHDHNVDALAGIKIAEKCVNGPATKQRILITKLAINFTNYNNYTISNEQYEKFMAIMGRIDLLANFQDCLSEICDTSYIYWHQTMLSSYLKQVIEKRIDFNSFQFLIQSMNSCGNELNNINVADIKLLELLQKSNFESIRTEIISNLCAKIETFLRLEVHSNLQLEKMNPFEQSINDYRDLINAMPIEVNDQYVILKDHVENYLTIMFYNLTTITLHDWKTYEEMRQLANVRLCLDPVKDYLPNQTLEQGIDILEIMRNIHIFVSKYVYNMNSQIFVEQQSSNKHLDTIGIRHVANSLRTHGTGIINTTVNFTYQFLRQKFYTFSQFLYDEQIKSRLMKELRAFSERKQSNNFPLYSYERADAFNKDIRKLGLSDDGQSYMDLFRKVITHIGNVMGYIRLVRSGSIHANYSASLYLPKFDENLQFINKAKEDSLHDVTINAAENFEINIKNLQRSFSDSTDYFKILVEAFEPFFRNPHNVHLKIFYLIIPPLTLNYIEYILSQKEKINKKDKHGLIFFDDGFAVGLAYILKLLDQTSDFNSLHWFTTVRDRFDAEFRKIKEMNLKIQTTNASKVSSADALKQKNENEKLQQTLALTERRINSYQSNFNLLYYNLCSAKIFFQ